MPANSSLSRGLAKPRRTIAPGPKDCWRRTSSSNKARFVTPRSGRVMKDNAECVAMPGAHAADTVAEVDAIDPAGSPHRAMVDREDHGIALRQWHHFRPRLHARALLGDDELAAGEVSLRLRQQD